MNCESAIVLCCDAGYLQHLAVVLDSLYANSRDVCGCPVYIISTGISADARLAIQEDVRLHGGIVHLEEVDASQIKDAPLHGHISLATYYRLLLPWILPSSCKRVLYLDADIVIEADVAELIRMPIGEKPVGAVANPGFDRWDELGMAVGAGYFNAGILLIDMDEWKRRRVSENAISYISANPDRLKFWDQDALNAVINGDWFPLDDRWNQQYRHWRMRRPSSMSINTWKTLLGSPFIIHYSSSIKPWLYRCYHPMRGRYFYYLDRTRYRGWRPKPRGSKDYMIKLVNLFLPVRWRI